jgi:midasin (ATPase involved in ribosome maturation)
MWFRCRIAPSHAAKLVAAMLELQRRRSTSNIFAGKHGFITPRDLFRWAERGAMGYQELAEQGYALLAERLRSEDEKAAVQDVLERIFKAKARYMLCSQLTFALKILLILIEAAAPAHCRLIWRLFMTPRAKDTSTSSPLPS